MTRHWVVLETGANQEYIFGSNRMRHVVGASQLVLDAGTRWVKEAIAALPDPAEVTAVQLVSGKAILLARSRQAGREVIRQVTRRALTDAPGLEISGAVGPAFDETASYRPWTADDPPSSPPRDHVDALRQTFTRQGHARAGRPAPHLRDQYLPWHEACRETALPAAGFEFFGPEEIPPASAGTLARTRARRSEDAEKRLGGLLGEHQILLPRLVNDLTGDGWIAVVHADGNGVGSLLRHLPDRVAQTHGVRELGLEQHAEWLRLFAERLDGATREAFRAAVNAVVPELQATGWNPEGRLLPILAGGDDVTFVCDAALALPLTRAFLTEFAAHTRQDGVLARVARPEGQGLAAAAGVAIVKRHHPFSAAYELAEDLVVSAKAQAVRRAENEVQVSAYDVHVAHESTLRDLSALRDDLVVDRAGQPVARHGGPYVVGSEAAPVPPELEHRDDRHLRALLDLLADGTLSSARAHDLRGALDRGAAEYRSRVTVALARSAQERALREQDDDAIAHLGRLLAVVADPGTGAQRVRLPDALLLTGVAAQARRDALPEDLTGLDLAVIR